MIPVYVLLFSIITVLIAVVLAIVLTSKDEVSVSEASLPKLSTLESEKEKKVYVFLYNDQEFNSKSHDLIKYFKNNYTVFQNHYKEIVQFLEENKSGDCIIMFYGQHITEKLYKIVKYVNQMTEVKSKIVFFTFDFWYRPPNVYIETWKELLKGENHYLTTFSLSDKHLKKFWGGNVPITNKNIVYDFNIWTSYDIALKCQYKEEVKNKICVSGEISEKNYPDRLNLLNFSGVERLEYDRNLSNDYTEQLSQYLCCFYTSVFANKNINTHITLLKFFEILCSGSLMLLPESEKEYTEKFGLKHKVNCWFVDTSNDMEIQKSVEYILNSKNRKEINKIRKKGKELSLQFRSEIKNRELMEKILTALSK